MSAPFPAPDVPDPVAAGLEPGEVGSDFYVVDRDDDDGADPEPDGTPGARGAQRGIGPRRGIGQR